MDLSFNEVNRVAKKKMPDIETDLFSCLQCGYCRNVCPAYEHFGWESNSPRGKLSAIRSYKQQFPIINKIFNEVKLGPEFFERLYHCTSCGACDEVCHVNIKLSHLWEEMKEWMIEEKGMKPKPAHRALYDRISDPDRRNPFYDEKDPKKDLLEKRGAWLPPDVKISDKPEVLFFAGCTSAYRLQPLAQAAVRLLSKANVPFAILGSDEWCCGSPLLRTGQSDIVKKKIARHNIDEIKKRGVSTVVTACAGCYNTIRGDYPKITGKLPFRIYHISVYLEKLIKEKKLTFSKEIKKKVTYHDPCHLGRHAGIFDAPRNIIKAIPGVTLVEMERNRSKSRCCGGGGGFRIGYTDISEDIAVDRVKEAKATGAELIVTPCPFCVVNLNAGAKKAGIDIKTVDLGQFLMQAL